MNNLTADQDALALAARWAVPPSGSQSLVVRKMRLKGTKLALREFEAPPFDGDITLGADGAVQRAQLASTGLRVDVTQKDKTWRATLDGRNWQAPLGPGAHVRRSQRRRGIRPEAGHADEHRGQGGPRHGERHRQGDLGQRHPGRR